MISQIEAALGALSARQRTIAHNLANLNTPGFTRSDIDFYGYMRQIFDGDDPGAPQAVPDRQSPERLDGNNVSLEREMFALSQTALQYEAVLRSGESELQRLRTAITEG